MDLLFASVVLRDMLVTGEKKSLHMVCIYE